jgi:hypothetical protein
MAALVLLAIFVTLGVLALCGRCADSRDPEFALGRVFARRRMSGADSR